MEAVGTSVDRVDSRQDSREEAVGTIRFRIRNQKLVSVGSRERGDVVCTSGQS